MIGNKQAPEPASGHVAPWGTVLLGSMALFLGLTWLLSPSPEYTPTQPPSPSPTPKIRPEWLGESDPSSIPPVAQKKPSLDALAASAAEELRQWKEEDDPALRDKRAKEMETLLEGANPKDIVEKLPPDVMDFALGLPFFQNWMTLKPEEAADWMGRQTDTSETRVTKLVHDWEQKDSAGIDQYVAELPAGDWKQKILTVATHDALARDPREAIEWADQLNPGPVQTGLLQTAATNWAEKDPQGAMQWVNAAGDSPLKDQLAASVAAGYANTNPTEAVHYAMATVQSDDLLDRSVADITRTWAGHDPAGVGAWLEQFPETDGRQMALEGLINVWGNSDRKAATAWVNCLPEGSLRKQAADLLATLPNASSQP